MREVPPPRPDDISNVSRSPQQERRNHLEDVEHKGQRQQPRARPAGGGGAQGPLPVPQLSTTTVVAAAQPKGLKMGHHRRRSDHHRRTHHPCPPAEIEILAVHVDLGVETTDGLKEVGAHQGHRPGDVEHLPDPVVLALIEFAGVHDRGRVAETVRSHPER